MESNLKADKYQPASQGPRWVIFDDIKVAPQSRSKTLAPLSPSKTTALQSTSKTTASCSTSKSTAPQSRSKTTAHRARQKLRAHRARQKLRPSPLLMANINSLEFPLGEPQQIFLHSPPIYVYILFLSHTHTISYPDGPSVSSY